MALPRFHEELRRSHALLDRQQEPFPGRSEREQPVQSSGDEELDVGSNGFLVERLAGVLQRCQCGGKGASKHQLNSKLRA